MTVTHMEILGSVGGSRPNALQLRATRDALSKYCELRWPRGRRKAVEAEWELTADEARSVCEGVAGATTIEKIWKHPLGGWAVALPVMASVIGHSVDEFLIAERRKHVETAQRHRALVRDLRALAPDRGDTASELGARRDGERRTFNRNLGEASRETPASRKVTGGDR